MDTGKVKSRLPRLLSINVSERKGERKQPIPEATVLKDQGIKGDVHSGSAIKQVSLLDQSEIKKMEERTGLQLNFGDFAENLTTKGLNLSSISKGKKLQVGEEVILVVSQIGKTCHDDCEIKAKTGECIMPQKGLFFQVLKGGKIAKRDPISFLEEG